MKLWITGAKGFLGATFQKACSRLGIPFISTVKDEVDISFFDQVERFLDSHSSITHIVNCAALAHVDLAEKNPIDAFRVNALGPENLGKIASARNIQIVHFSTEYIFNGCANESDFNENVQPRPIGVYAATKREGEIRLLSAFPKACIIRTSWLFGGDGKTFLSSLFEKIKKENLLRVDADQKGRPTYVEDLVQIVFALLDHHGIFHFANRGEASRYEIALRMRECALECGIPISCNSIIPMQSNAFAQINKRPNQCILNTSKIEEFLQAAIRPWEEAVKDLVLAGSMREINWV